ncbi:aminotransferase class III-fold pyridoxal phosphate-dependent enzyme [Alphaproteobacteria bacterium]|nr:aminotransferase class III-fold pyridoxal phosphate-dependent enzyme [Alphaproteobacteria bacterium]
MKNFLKTKIHYDRAIKTIPLASQTFSKSSMNFVKGASPLFIDRGDGCQVFDIDGNEYIDYVLGLLPIILGYRDVEVNNSIIYQLNKGISFSLPSMLEAELSELLVDIIPCAEMVRFGKNGSDVTSAAIRLARAFTGKNKIISCGYHGWHDWYIGSTSRNLGVPDEVRSLTNAINFGDSEKLEHIINKNIDDLACLIIEPPGKSEEDFAFLKFAREITYKNNIILIFDEIVTGFRMDIGGAQQFYDITPDLACFGKAMGNGMPISAIVGRKEIMNTMDKIFFSGTFGGEALSITAAITTIKKLIDINAIPKIHSLGSKFINEINLIIKNKNLNNLVEITGPNWKPFIKVADDKDFLMTSLLRQELIENGLLIGGFIGLCYAHCDDKYTNATLKAWTVAIDKLKYYFDTPDPSIFLRGEKINPVFKVR